jgi:hypothetical protein
MVLPPSPVCEGQIILFCSLSLIAVREPEVRHLVLDITLIVTAMRKVATKSDQITRTAKKLTLEISAQTSAVPYLVHRQDTHLSKTIFFELRELSGFSVFFCAAPLALAAFALGASSSLSLSSSSCAAETMHNAEAATKTCVPHPFQLARLDGDHDSDHRNHDSS